LLSQVWQPFLLALNELSCDSAAREPDRELGSQPKDGVVPACVNGCYVKPGEFGMLCLNHRANQILIDLNFRCWGTTVHVEITYIIVSLDSQFIWPPAVSTPPADRSPACAQRRTRP